MKKINLLSYLMCVSMLNVNAQLNDGSCIPTSSIDLLSVDVPEQNVCTNLSNAPQFNLPTSNLPNVEFAIELNGSIDDLNATGLPTSALTSGDEVCVILIHKNKAFIL